MVDFRKKLNTSNVEKKTNPLEIYQTLDRRSITGPLRPAQELILTKWYDERKNDRDLIIKLHTGEGKTLIGLLILQSQINAGKGPCLFVCPNIYLVEQVTNDAQKFGIPITKIETDNILPNDFLDGKKILITHVQKAFNGKSIFGINNKYVKTGSIVLDDAHACIDSIKDTFTLTLSNGHEAYQKILNLFSDTLPEQGNGTFLEILEGSYNSFLPIPYWAWIEKSADVLQILSSYKDASDIMFVWPLIKDNLDKCQAFISGTRLEISPIHIPIEKFSFFSTATSRILMSATTQDDSFFIKGLGLSAESTQNILLNPEKKWSGEKMILIPSLIDDDLTHNAIVNLIAKPRSNRNFGTISIVSSFEKTRLYHQLGALTPSSKEIVKTITDLKKGNYEKPIVLANRYDGIDLPDESCRVLALDGKPNFHSLTDRYEENCRLESDYYNIKTAQKIEQGLGRSVRGEKDYSIILIIGPDLVKFVKSSQTNKYFSDQTRKQIEIGIEIARLAIQEIENDDREPIQVLIGLINQSLQRDEGWKDFYKSEMDTLSKFSESGYNHKILELEREASKKYYQSDFEGASALIQKLIDLYIKDEDLEKGWFLQLKARYEFNISKVVSNDLQKTAFRCNNELLKPREGISYKKLSYISENRNNRINKFLKESKSYPELMLTIEEVLSNLDFGVSHEKFESAFKKLGLFLGFLSERPDKEIKTGPDNLWCVSDNEYLIFECKSEVDSDRSEIIKSEASQMNSHCAWFENEYGKDFKVRYFMIIPTLNLAKNADFTHNVEIIRKNRLKLLRENVRNFFKEFSKYNLGEVTSLIIQDFLNTHKLDVNSLKNDYSEEYRKLRK